MARLRKGQDGAGAESTVLTVLVPEVKIHRTADIFIQEVEIRLERVFVENLLSPNQVYGVPLFQKA